MADEHQHRHFYLVPALLPQPDDTDTEWIQKVAMLGDMLEEVAKLTFHVIQANAPVLLAEETLLPHLIAGIGVLTRGIHSTGAAQLAKRGLAPLDPEEEQVRVVQDELAKPNLPPDLREALLAILQHNLERSARQPTDTEWPEGGFVLGGDSE